MKVGIIGAGPAGITAAYQLAKAGVSVDVFDAGDTVGGMAKTIELWGQKVDLGPHRFFSSSKQVNAIWLEVMKTDFRMVKRQTRILYQGRLFSYPLEPFNVLVNLGFFESLRCLLSCLKAKLVPNRVAQESFQSWVVRNFGQRLFEIFFKTYSEKLWDIPCDAIDTDFAEQRIRKMSLVEAVKNAFRQGSDHRHRSLVETFPYPLQGTGEFYVRMGRFIEQRSGNIFLDTKVKRIIVENNKAVGLELMDGTIKKYDHLISTMPLTHLVKGLPKTPEAVAKACAKLSFRNTILVYLHIEGENLFPDNWIYVHNSNLRTGRLTNFRNWVPELYGEHRSTILSLEYWCNDSDEIWHESDASLIARAKEEVLKTGLVKHQKILDGHVIKIPRCYPVYKIGYKTHLDKITSFLATISNLHVIGRYGAFKYNNQDHCIQMGVLAAENICRGETIHDLWAVNSSDEYHESALISDLDLEFEESKVA